MHRSAGLFTETIIYEMHVRGFTAHPNSGIAPSKRGTYAGPIEKIPYFGESRRQRGRTPSGFCLRRAGRLARPQQLLGISTAVVFRFTSRIQFSTRPALATARQAGPRRRRRARRTASPLDRKCTSSRSFATSIPTTCSMSRLRPAPGQALAPEEARGSHPPPQHQLYARAAMKQRYKGGGQRLSRRSLTQLIRQLLRKLLCHQQRSFTISNSKQRGLDEIESRSLAP